MRLIAIIALAALITLGCGKNDADTRSQPEGAGAGDLNSGPATDGGTASKPDNSAGAADVDPALKDYVYPGSQSGGTFSMGNTVSHQFTTNDDFATVVDFYRQKFPDANPPVGTSAYFGKQAPDGGGLTVTLTKTDNGTQIILRLEKKG